MKSNIIYVCFAVLASLMTSCLATGDNEIVLYAQPSVVKVMADKKVMLLGNGTTIMADDLTKNINLEDGDCAITDFVLELSDYKNINRADSGGHYSAHKMSITSLAKEQLLTSLTDTLALLENEQSISNVLNKTCVIDNNIFLYMDFASELSGAMADMSYKVDTVPDLDKDKRVYNLYFRMTGNAADERRSTVVCVAVDLHPFVSVKGREERGLGNDSLFFKINYVNGIKTDPETAVWKKSQTFYIPLN